MNKDLAASIRARLLNIAKAQGADFNQVLVRFALERMPRLEELQHFQTLSKTLKSAKASLRPIAHMSGKISAG